MFPVTWHRGLVRHGLHVVAEAAVAWGTLVFIMYLISRLDP